jgi:hypothetical protein
MGKYPETGLEEIDGNLLEADLGPLWLCLIQLSVPVTPEEP